MVIEEKKMFSFEIRNLLVLKGYQIQSGGSNTLFCYIYDIFDHARLYLITS